MLQQEPLVSILCIAFNHESYIREAIQSFIAQKTTFPVEIIIHDDASTDNTPAIVQEYCDQTPDIIKPILQSENQFSKHGFSFLVKLFEKAKGKYIALCEGDDYWIDPLKLQKQVDFLEANLDFSICFHKVLLLKHGQLRPDDMTQVPSQISTILDLARGNYIHTPSCMFRNYGTKIFGSHFSDSPVGDYYIHMMNAQFGKIYCLNEVMAVYRLHENSTWSSKDELYREINYRKARFAILKDLLPTSHDAIQILFRTYIEQSAILHERTKDDSIKEEILQQSPFSKEYFVDCLLQQSNDLSEARKEIAKLRKQQFFRRIARFIRSKLG